VDGFEKECEDGLLCVFLSWFRG